MSFDFITFEAHVKSVNGHFEWFKTSTLHTLIALLKKYPSKTSPQQVHHELTQIPTDKQNKYKAAIDYVRQEIPLMGFGLTQSSLRTAVQAQHHVVPNLLPPPSLRPDVTGKLNPAAQTGQVSDKIKAHEKVSRKNLVLSGHGCWAQESNDTWPMVQLKKGQEIHFYCPHYTPLSNAMGQKIDNHQAVNPTEVIVGPAEVFDYTLQQKGTLNLLNRMEGSDGNQLDSRFITVDSNTRLSHFINDPERSTTVFHWAACRVVFSKLGEKWDPVARRWMTFNRTTRTWS